MPSSSEGQQGGELLLHELREEARRLVHHPIGEVKRLEHVADEGESPTTPLLVAIAVTAFVALIATAVIAVALTVYYKG